MKWQWCESELFIQNNNRVQRFVRIFISNGKKGKESKIAERQRESVCEMQTIAAGKKKIASSIKQTIRE